VILARALSLSDFGLVNVGIAAFGVVYTVAALGLPETAAKHVAIDQLRAPRIAGAVLSARLAAVLAGSGLGLAIIAVVWPERVWFFSIVAVMVLVASASADWLGRGLERMATVARATAAGGATVLAGAVLVAATNGSAEPAIAAFAVGEAVAAILCWRALKDVAWPTWVRGEVSLLVREAWPVALSSLIVYSYYFNIDTLIIAASRTGAEAGLYSAPYRVFLALNVVGIFAAYSYFPSISRAAVLGDNSAADRMRVALGLLAAYGLLVLGVAEVAASNVLRFLFGAKFESAGETFVLLTIGVAWYSVGYPLGYGLIARGRPRGFLAGAAVAGILSIGLNLLLIPPYGITAAAAVTAGAIAAGSLVWIYLAGEFRSLMRLLTALVIASAVAVAAVASDGLSVAAGVFTLTVGLYLGLSTTLRLRLA